jgi:hypothetical protein
VWRRADIDVGPGEVVETDVVGVVSCESARQSNYNRVSERC